MSTEIEKTDLENTETENIENADNQNAEAENAAEETLLADSEQNSVDTENNAEMSAEEQLDNDDGEVEKREASSSEDADQQMDADGVELSDEEATQGVLNLADENSEGEAKEEQPLEFIESMQLFSIIESLLFATDKPLSLTTLKQVFLGTTVTTKMIKLAMDQMMSVYADPSRGVALEEVNGGWQLRTKLDNMDFLKRIVKTRPFRLSGPALEVLSIIAYKQPIIKNEVDQIRGVESGHLVRALMDKGLVSFEGKTDLPGKPMAYSTTRKFLEIFGLRNLNELPSLGEIDQLLPEGIGEEVEEKETLSDVTDRMSTEVTTASYSDGEEELMDITNKLGAISTSSEFFEQEKLRQKQKREKEKAEDIREALAMGEVVPEKEVRWLEKYEAQLQQEEQAAALAQLQAAEAAQQAASAEENAGETGVDTEVVVETVEMQATVEVSLNEEAELLADALINEDDSTDAPTEDLESEPVGEVEA